MNKSKLKTMELKELETRYEKVLKELSELKYDVRIGQEKDYSKISKKKREIATINTLIKEIELGLHEPLKKEVDQKKEAKKVAKVEKIEKAEEKEEVKVKSKKSDK